MNIKELREYISQLDNLLPSLMKRLQVPDPHKLFGIRITPQQYLVLDVLVKKGKCMVTELSQSLDVALSTMTELVNRLVKKRFVKKSSDTKDRRIVWVNLTDKGSAIIRRIDSKKQEYISVMLEKLERHERQGLMDILNRVSSAVREIEMKRVSK